MSKIGRCRCGGRYIDDPNQPGRVACSRCGTFTSEKVETAAVNTALEENMRLGLLCACNQVRVPYRRRWRRVDGVIHRYNHCGNRSLTT